MRPKSSAAVLLLHATLIASTGALVSGCGARPSGDLPAADAARGAALPSTGDGLAFGRDNPLEKGPYAVGYERLAFVDPSRNPGNGGRLIAALVWYPVDAEEVDASTAKAAYPLDTLYELLPDASSADFEALGLDGAYAAPRPSRHGPFPLVMFSSALGGDSTLYVYAGTRLASHGFVVAVLTHDGEGTSPAASFDHPMTILMNRPRDVSFALTQILARSESRSDLLHGLVRGDRVAAAGHSFGGATAMTLAGGDDTACDTGYLFGWAGDPPPEACVPTAPDPRIRAIVHFDGSNQVLRFSELSRIAVPSLGVGEGLDGLSWPPPWLAWNARPHAAISSPHSFRVDLNQTIHMSYSNMCQIVPIWQQYGVLGDEAVQWYLAEFCESPNPELQGGTLRPPLETLQLASGYAIAFLDKYVGEDDRFTSMLTPGWAITQHANIEFFRTERGGDVHVGPEELANFIDPAWDEEFRYFAHQPGSR